MGLGLGFWFLTFPSLAAEESSSSGPVLLRKAPSVLLHHGQSFVCLPWGVHGESLEGVETTFWSGFPGEASTIIRAPTQPLAVH